MAAIEVSELARRYVTRTGVLRRRKTEIWAVSGLTFDVAEGELFGLLGPNGAGKTTTIKILTTLLLPTEGSARVAGYDVVADTRQVRRRIGYVFGGDRGLYDRLSGYDNLSYFADVYRVPARNKRRRIEELLELVGLKGRERERVEHYSRGMRQRLHIARGLLHDPAVLFFDEPTIGLDPVGARELRAAIAALREAGKTILLTTHYMFEADELCDRIAVIAQGRIVSTGTPAALKAALEERHTVEIEVFGVPESTVARLRALEGVSSLAVEIADLKQTLVVHSRQGAALVPALLRELDGVAVGRVVAREPTLEDAYVELVGRG